MLAKLTRLLRLYPMGALLVMALAVRLATLGAYPLMDTTEARYAEMARKMVETGNWLVPQFDYGVPFWGKPPLSLWLTAASFRVMGISEFAARLPTFLVTLVIVGLIFSCARQRHGSGFGWGASAIFVTSVMTFVLAGAVLMDPVLTLGTTLAMVAFWRAITGAHRLWGYGFFVGLAIGLLAKGPVTLLLVGIPVGIWAVAHRHWRMYWQRLPVISGTLLMLALSLPWYVLAERASPGFLEYFLLGEHWKRFTEPGWMGDLYGSAHQRTHGIIWWHGLVAVLPWSLVIPVLLLRAKWRMSLSALMREPSLWGIYLIVWMLAPLLLFTLSGNILATYVYPGVPAFALLAAETWHSRPTDSNKIYAPWSLPLRIGLLTPLVFVGGVWLASEIDRWKTEKFLVLRYLELNRGQGARLAYLGERPFSAEFYASGKAIKLHDLEEMAIMLATTQDAYFAVRHDQRKAVSDRLGALLTEVGGSRRFILYKKQSP